MEVLADNHHESDPSSTLLIIKEENGNLDAKNADDDGSAHIEEKELTIEERRAIRRAKEEKFQKDMHSVAK